MTLPPTTRPSALTSCLTLSALLLAANAFVGCLADRSLPSDLGERAPCDAHEDCPERFTCPDVPTGVKSFCVPLESAACGNAVLDEGEQCDDGNLVGGDGCTSACVAERCGNGVLDPGEACDDGNDIDEDACLSSCAANVCGDGVRNAAVEECDDANDIEQDDCLSSCLANVCGDGVVNALSEACDDGDDDDEDACRSDCQENVCGDGFLFAGVESCDDGNTTSGDDCRGDCLKVEECGDALLDEGEACDDGNLNPSDGCDACARVRWEARVLVGHGEGGADLLATDLPPFLRDMARDAGGNLYFTTLEGCRVYRLHATTGTIAAFAGNGTCGFSGDGGPAGLASLNDPWGLAVDSAGRVYVSDSQNHRVRRIDKDGTIETVAGSSAGFSGDGGPATLASLEQPTDIALDGAGRLYIADSMNFRVRRVELDGVIDTVVGNGGAVGPEGAPGALATDVPLYPEDLAVDGEGRLYVSDSLNARLRRLEADGTFPNLVGNGFGPGGGDGGDAGSGWIDRARAITIDDAGRVYLVQHPGRIRRIDEGNVIDTIAGSDARGDAGDGGPATEALFSDVADVLSDGQGGLLVLDRGSSRLRLIAEDGTIRAFAGSGTPGGFGAPRPALSGRLGGARHVAVDENGRLLLPASERAFLWRQRADGTLETLVGSGQLAHGGDGGAATSATIATPLGVAKDSAGRIFVSDATSHVVRRIDVDGRIQTVAGTPESGGDSGAGGPATSARLRAPGGLAFDGDGRLIIVDGANSRVRVLEPDGTLNELAGTGLHSFSGDGGPAVDASLAFPTSVAVNQTSGDVYIADRANHRIRRVAANGTITTVAGDGERAFDGDGGPATAASLDSPFGVAIDPAGRVVLSDTFHHRVRRIESDGTISTIAGTGEAGFSGDGGEATAAQLSFPSGLFFTPAGELLISDDNGERVRRVSTDGIIETIAGGAVRPASGSFADASLVAPSALVMLNDDVRLYATSLAGQVGRVDLSASIVDVPVGHPAGLSLGEDPADLGGVNRAALLQALDDAAGLAYDGEGSVFVSDRGRGVILRISLVDPDDASTWTVQPFLGDADDRRHNDGPFEHARFVAPAGLFFDPGENALYVVDAGSHTVRHVDFANDNVETYLGTPGAQGSLGVLLDTPEAVTLAADGSIYVADTGNHRVRRRTPDGSVSTVLGTGEPAASGEGQPAFTFPVNAPRGVALDEHGNLLVTSTTALRLVTAGESGVVDGSGRVLTLYGRAPRDAFPENATRCLTAVNVVSDGVVEVTDACQGYLLQLRRVEVDE